jgi:hypothetical protein
VQTTGRNRHGGDPGRSRNKEVENQGVHGSIFPKTPCTASHPRQDRSWPGRKFREYAQGIERASGRDARLPAVLKKCTTAAKGALRLKAALHVSGIIASPPLHKKTPKMPSPDRSGRL